MHFQKENGPCVGSKRQNACAAAPLCCQNLSTLPAAHSLFQPGQPTPTPAPAPPVQTPRNVTRFQSSSSRHLCGTMLSHPLPHGEVPPSWAPATSTAMSLARSPLSCSLSQCYRILDLDATFLLSFLSAISLTWSHPLPSLGQFLAVTEQL